MKKFSTLICWAVMATMVLSLSGCGGSDNDNSSQPPVTSSANKLMVVSSPVLQRNGSYRLYRGNTVTVNDSSYNPKYYVAPATGSETVTMNLQFADSIAEDKPFAITDEEGMNVVFYYNPNGTGQDITTQLGGVIRTGGSNEQLSYSGLTLTSAMVSGAAVDVDTSDEVVIVLDGDTAQANGSSVPSYNYAWHADPDHKDEYYTLELEGTTEFTEAQMLENIDSVNGVYINRDIRYMPNTITFEGTAKNDEETEYVAYYSEAVRAEVAEELGTGYEGPFIFATLPQSMGQGGAPGGMGGPGDQRGQRAQLPDPRMSPDDPKSVVYSAVSNSDIAAFETMTHSADEAYDNPVLHITESGTYRLQGTWNGQIWVEVVDDKVALILDGVTVTCTVAPALVFKEVYECGPEEAEDVVSFDVADHMHSESGTNAGAIVVIADGSTNSFTGANVYRMLKPEPKKNVTAIDGSDVSQQKKRYKMDGAFYSFKSIVIGAENNPGTGTLSITSTTYEGLDGEMHMLIDSGTINVTAEDDGINVNEDDTSVFTMNGGTLTIIAKNGLRGRRERRRHRLERVHSHQRRQARHHGSTGQQPG